MEQILKNTFISQKPEPSGVPQVPENGSSGHGIRLTGSSLACGVFLLLVAMPLAYMTGVMVGRDNPLQPLPAEVAQSDRTEQGAESAENAETDGQKDDDQKSDTENAGKEILGPAELSFSRVLRAAPGEKVAAPGENRRYAMTGGPDSNATQPKMVPGMSPAVIMGPPEPPAEKASTYDFVFQVATYRTLNSAEQTRQRLENKGYRIRLERQGRLIVVLLRCRGPESKPDEIKAAMARLGMGEPLEKSRRPVFRPALQ